MSKSFELFGQTLVIEDDFLTDIRLRRMIMHHAEEAQREFEEFYQKKLHSMKSLMENGEEKALEILKKHAIKCADVVVSWGIHTLSASEILRQTAGSYFGREFNDLEQWYISVLQNEAEKDAYRTARRKNRSKWVGGGFGLNNAAYAATQAGVLNLASGAVHGTFNLIGKGFSTIGSSVTKESMFKDKNTRQRLASALYMDVFEWIYIIETAIQNSGYRVRTISNADEEQAQAMFENLQRMTSGANSRQAYNIAYRIFATNPSEYEYYEFCFLNFVEQQKALVELAEYCGVDLSPVYESVFEKIYKTEPHTTEEETLALKEKLEAKRADLGISRSVTIAKVDKMLQDFDIAARTFRNVTYETRETKMAAENDYQELSKRCQGLENMDSAMCAELQEHILEEAYMADVSQEFLELIEKRLAWLDYELHEKRYKELFERDCTDNPKLKSTKKWWRIPLILTFVWITMFVLAIMGIYDGGFIEISMWVVFILWGVFSVRKDSKIEKYAKEDTLEERKLRDAAFERHKKAKEKCEETEKLHQKK